MPKYRTVATVVYTVEAEHTAPTVSDAIGAAYEWAKEAHHLETPEYSINVEGRQVDQGCPGRQPDRWCTRASDGWCPDHGYAT